MTLLNKFVGHGIKCLGDFLGHDSEIVAAVEVSEAADQQKAIDAIKRSVMRSSKTYLVVVIEV